MIWTLFFTYLKIGLCSFGGGYAILPLINQYVVTDLQLLSHEEFIDIIALSQMTPGPLAINAATFTGIRAAGFWGGVVSTFGCILPTCIIVLVLAYLFYKYNEIIYIRFALRGIRPAVIGLIGYSALSIIYSIFINNQTSLHILKKFSFNVGGVNLNILSIIIFVCAFIGIRKYKLNSMIVLVICGSVTGISLFFIDKTILV